jgi:hypothetical protein
VIDDDWRLVDHGVDVALAHAWHWAVAARAQLRRVVEQPGTDEQIPDAFLLIVAIRNVLRAADFAFRSFSTEQARAQLAEALGEFDVAVPGAKQTRDVLEHFDDYSQGRGDLQHTRRATRVADETRARSYAVDFGYADAPVSFTRPTLTVGPHVIELTTAAEAVSRLVHEIWAAAKTDEGDPVSREAVRAFLQNRLDP